MKIFNMDWKQNKLPREMSMPKKNYSQPPLVNPDFYVSANPRMAAQLGKFDPIQPKQIRADSRAAILERVDTLNAHIKKNRKYRHLSFGYHEASGKRYVVVTDTSTGKRIGQFPSDALLTRAGVLRDVSGLLTSAMG